MTKHKHSGANHRGAEHASPYGLSRLAPAVTLVDMVREIETADRAIGHAAAGKLGVIAEQIHQLQAQARAIVEQAQRDLELHRAACSFERTPGHTYHLYQKADGRRVWSIVSPAEWGGCPPHDYCGSYRLEYDRSWTPLRDAAGAMVAAVAGGSGGD